MRGCAVAVSRRADAEAVARDLALAFGPVEPAAVLVFASPREDLDLPALHGALRAAFPGAVLAGCTTAGEVTPEGLVEGAVSAFALLPPGRAAARWVPRVAGTGFAEARRMVAELAADLGLEPAALDPRRHLFVTLTDGLCGAEEILVAGLFDAAPAIPLVGGSAGDAGRYEATEAFVGERGGVGSAAVLLLEPAVPFHPFAVHHFRGTGRRHVVTRAVPERRLVLELDGWPAARRFAEAVGADVDDLRSGRVQPGALPLQFGFLAGGELFVRGVMKVEGDALVMGGAVEEGTVLRIVEAGDMVAETGASLASAAEAVGGTPSAFLLFHCFGRLLHARRAGREEALSAAIRGRPAAGFSTYGEQFGPLQVNYTLAGVAFGEAGHG